MFSFNKLKNQRGGKASNYNDEMNYSAYDQESEEIVIDRVSEDEGENEGLEKDQFSHENGETTQGSRKRAKKIVEVDPMEKMSAEFISAARSSNTKLLEELIDKGVDINTRVCGSTALMYATFYGQERVIGFLLEKGADPDIPNFAGETALMLAVERKNMILTQLLLKYNADANKADSKGSTVLSRAVKLGLLDFIKILVDEGNADVDEADTPKEQSEGNTPLHEAAFLGFEDIVLYLLEKGASADSVNKQGKTPLHRAVLKNHAAIAQVLIENGAYVDHEDATHRTPAHWAAFFGYLESFKVLVDNGADLEKKDKTNSTPEMIAKSKKNQRILEFLSSWQEQKNMLQF